ncbi:hypothetical protein Tco_0782387, partial [Tanacetum coccineum]
MDLESAQNNVVAKLPLLKHYGTSTSTTPGPVTTKEKAQKKNDLKARSMLLMALPNEHLLTFSQYKDAKTLFEAIQARFGGNDATKKTQKTLLKGQKICNHKLSSGSVSTPGSTNEVDNANIQVSTVSIPVSTVNDLEEIDLKWQLALLSMRARRYYQRTDTSSKAMVAIDGTGFDWSFMADEEVPTNMALMAFSDSE